MSLKNDAKAEMDRLQYLLDNYCFGEDERRLVEELLEHARIIYCNECINKGGYIDEIRRRTR